MRLPKTLTLTKRKDGRWAKKIDGQIKYFGRGTEEEARQELIDFLASSNHSSTPSRPMEGKDLHIADMLREWCDKRVYNVQTGTLNSQTLAEYRIVTERLVGLDRRGRLMRRFLAEDVDLPADIRDAVGTASPEITKKRCVYATTLLRAVGISLKIPKPTKAEIRKYKAQQPRKLMSAREFEVLLSAACPTMRAALLLGLNCGFHSIDAARLEWTHIKSGVIDHPRQKTGIARQCPLWPETLAALRDADFGLPGPILRTQRGNPLIVDHESGTRTNMVSQRIRRLRSKAGMIRPITFCWLRSTFRTIVDHHPDLSAVRRIMGHEVGDGAESTYIQAIHPDRLKAVCDIVRNWLGF